MQQNFMTQQEKQGLIKQNLNNVLKQKGDSEYFINQKITLSKTKLIETYNSHKAIIEYLEKQASTITRANKIPQNEPTEINLYNQQTELLDYFSAVNKILLDVQEKLSKAIEQTLLIEPLSAPKRQAPKTK